MTDDPRLSILRQCTAGGPGWVESVLTRLDAVDPLRQPRGGFEAAVEAACQVFEFPAWEAILPPVKNVMRKHMTKALTAALAVLRPDAEVERLRTALRQFADYNNWDDKPGYLNWIGKRHAIDFAESVLCDPHEEHVPTPSKPDPLTTQAGDVDLMADATTELDAIYGRLAALEARPAFTEEMRALIKAMAISWNSGLELSEIWRNRRTNILRGAFPPEPAAPVWPAECIAHHRCTTRCHGDNSCPHAGEYAPLPPRRPEVG